MTKADATLIGPVTGSLLMLPRLQRPEQRN